jgi:hypothetical protein
MRSDARFAHFAACEIEERVVIMLPGRDELSKSTRVSGDCDWSLSVTSAYFPSKNRWQDAEAVWENYPSITVHVGSGADLGELRVPFGVKLVEVGELRAHYLKGLRSQDHYLKSYCAQRLANLDPYGAESAALVAKLMDGKGFGPVMESAVAEFKKRGKDPAHVRAHYEADERRIRDFVFYGRYRWFVVALGAVVTGAVTLLVTTLVKARTRRAVRRRALASGADAA